MNLAKINDRLVVRLDDALSKSFPSRGMVMAEVNIADRNIILPLEPDGHGGHWFYPDESGISVSQLGELELHVADKWIEPSMPPDIMNAFNHDPIAREMWETITTKARWEWLRWIRSTANPITRAKRIRVSIDKMHKGMRRPCCFNQSMCTVPEVSKNGLLIEH
ncbi:MAG: YdeI/OmpD-associated family protein [Candidatus Saccharimonas sp.]|nr:YdeI/OmpD-associated family protein [Candidatus Saccharimonas sp.]